MSTKSLQSCMTLYNPIDCSSCRLLCPPLGFSRQEYWSGLSCPSPVDSPPGDRTCISCGSRIAGRFFSAEPLGKAPQLMYRMANSYIFYFTIFDTSLSSVPFVENFLLNSLKSGFAFITSSRSSSFIKMQPLFSYIQKYFSMPFIIYLTVFCFVLFCFSWSFLDSYITWDFHFSPFIILATIFHMLNLLYIQCSNNLSRTDPKGFSFIDFP